MAPDWEHDAPLLRPGETCWRLERAHRLAPIVDAADYFKLVRNALLQARHSILFIGWEFDTRIKLDPSAPLSEWPQELGPFLSSLIDRRPGLCIRVLQWNLGLIGTLMHGSTSRYFYNWMSRKRFQYRLDSKHPLGAAHHQKIIVIDDALAFCGGIDMTDDRWDTREHRDDDPLRVHPSGQAYWPFHDATMAVDGAAAGALGELARDRWYRATGERIAAPPPVDGSLWPAGLEVRVRDVNVGIARTEPAYQDKAGVREIEMLHLAAIAAARSVIYIEGQYFAARCVGEAIAARLREEHGPEVIVINSEHARGFVEEKVMGSARQRLLSLIRSADTYRRFRIFRPVTQQGAPIYVHAKILVIDDRLLRIGSANLNNRSMGFDTECDLAIEAIVNASDFSTVAGSIRSFRDELLAEHLDIECETLRETLKRNNGSFVATIELLQRDDAKSLVPIAMPLPNATQLGESELLDPEVVEPLGTKIIHALRDLLGRKGSIR